MAKNTTVVCPKCGAHIAIADHQHVAIGIVIGKLSVIQKGSVINV